MAFPAIGSTNTTNGTTATTSPVVNLPTGIVAGNLLLVLFRGASLSGDITWPAGWTELFDDASDASNDETTMAWRKADGTEGATITLSTPVSGKFAALSWRITGAADPTVQPPQFATLATGASVNPNPGSLTPTGGAKDYLWLAVGGWEGEQTSPPGTFPANYTLNQIGADSGIAGAVATNCRLAGAGRQLNAASEDPGAFTISVSDDWTATTLAIHPGGTLHELAGIASSVSSAVGAVVLFGALLGSTLGASSGVATLNQTHQASGAAIATSSGTALLGRLQPANGTAAGVSSGVGNLVIAKVLVGSTLGQSSAVGALLKTNALVGVSVSSSSGLGNLLAQYALAGVSSGTASGLASLGRIHAAAGITAGISSGTALLGLVQPVAGIASGTSSGTGNLVIAKVLAGVSVSSSSGIGSLTGLRALAGETVALSSGTAALALRRTLDGVTVGPSSGVGDLTILSGGGGTLHLLAATATGLSSGVATLSIFSGTIHELRGVTVGNCWLAGTLLSPTIWVETAARSVLMKPLTHEVIGQAVKSGISWLAYDNDPAKHDGKTALLLGRYPFLPEAKAVIEKLVK
jgi:hypothetical protein